MAYGIKKKEQIAETKESKISATAEKMAKLSGGIGVNLNRPDSEGDALNKEHPSLKI